MAVAKSHSFTESSLCSCTCFRVEGLRETILDSKDIANLKDRYDLGQQLGWGQFGIIRECFDKFSGDILACKSISKDRLVTQADVRGIKLEIEIMTRLSGHPNVVDLKAVYEEENYVHLVMELCAGGELFHMLEKLGRLSEPEARILFRQLMQVVMYCHDKGVVHRDLKPENILLATKLSHSPIKLADFGLATYIKPGVKLQGTVGSPFYIAPEVLAGGYDQAADIWSAGVILYILLSGIPPFWGKTKSQIFDAVRAADLRFQSNPWDFISDSAKELIKGMLCRDASKRLTAQQILDHCWVNDTQSIFPVSSTRCEQLYRQDLEQGGSSHIIRSRDISFGIVGCEVSSPTFTCKSSFSPFMVDLSTPSLGNSGFSFHSSDGANTMKFSADLFALPSFAFLRTSYVVEQDIGNSDVPENSSGLHSMQRASSMDLKAVEFKKVSSGEARRSGMPTRRHHTISLGEFEQLDVVVTESVIRWASCTHLPTANTLQSSFVC